jgi:hypothetical protein
MACMIWVQSQFCILVLHFFVLCYFVWYIILGWQELQLNWGYWFLHTLALLEFCEHYYWVYKYVQWCFNLFIHQFYWGINHVQWCFVTSYYTTRGSRHMAWCFIIKQAHAFAVFMLYNDDCYSYMPMLMMFTCILTESLLNKPMHLLFSCCTMIIIILTCLCQWCFLKLSTGLCQWCFFKKLSTCLYQWCSWSSTCILCCPGVYKLVYSATLLLLFCLLHFRMLTKYGSLLTVYFGTPSMFITIWFGFDYGTNLPLGTLII